MVKTMKNIWCELNQFTQFFILFFVLLFSSTLGGCWVSKKPVTTKPAIVEPVILMDGQTGMLLENVSVLARIPYQGETLYEGPVMFQAGSMVVKPRAEIK